MFDTFSSRNTSEARATKGLRKNFIHTIFYFVKTVCLKGGKTAVNEKNLDV